MLKTVSSITNAIGALNYKGTWNASTNTPALASGAGTKGDYYQVSVAGSTTLDGISNWGVGDVAAFNGTTWQRIEGGADLNGVNLLVSGTSTLSGLTASTALALNASKEVVSVTNTGSGNNVLATQPTFASTIGVGGAAAAASGAGVTFPASISASSDANTLDDYEEGTWTPAMQFATPGTSSFGYARQFGTYVKVGQQVTVSFIVHLNAFSKGTGSGDLWLTGLPFAGSQASMDVVYFGVPAYFDAPCPINHNALLVIPNLTYMVWREMVSNSPWAGMPDPDANAQYMGTVTYRCN